MTRFYGQDLSILPGLLADKNLVVVPFLGAESNAFYEQMGEALRPFVQAGGGLIFAGTNNPYGLNAFGILQCDTDIQDAYQYGMEAIEPQHPILQGVNLQTPAPDDLFIANFSSPGFKPLAGVSGFSHTAVGVQPLGAGRVVYIGHVFGNQNNDVLTLMENAVKWCALPTWLSVSSSTLMIPAGGSATIQVGFSAEGLTENTFLGNLLFSTNDPHNPTLNIPCTLIVVGEPQLVGIETSLHFGIIQQFAQKDLSIDFENIGCDTLNILSAISDNAAFQVLDFDAATLTNGTGKLFLRFAPILPGNQSANVTLLTDDGTFVVALTGIAVGAPVATVVPAALSVDLDCREASTLNITLSNIGLGSMNYQVGNLQTPRNVLAITYGTNNSRWNSIRSALLQQVPNLTLLEYGGSVALQLADSITQKRVDVLMVPPLDYSADPTYAAFAPIIQSFLQNGGQVLVFGTQQTDGLEQMGLFDLIGTDYSASPIVHIVDQNHRITAGVADEYQVEDICYFGSFPFGEVRPLIEGLNAQQTFLGYRNVGLGNVVYWAQSFDYVHSSTAVIVKNLFAWFSNPVPSGISIPAVGGIIPIGGSLNIPVVFSGQNLPGGQYNGQIRLYTNDPVHNQLVVPVTMNISFKPCTDFASSSSPCSGVVEFHDNTLNNASSWYWEFGDGANSFNQHPKHTYISENIYNVSLVSCNNFGCDTFTQAIEVFSIDGPQLANCNPQTSSGSCCDAGIKRVQIGLLDHTSGNAVLEGYKDFSCTEGTELMAGIQFPVTVTTGNENAEYVRGWIDLNNNGVFTDNEQIINDQAYLSHHTFFTPPISAVKDMPLRMRIMSEPTFTGSIASPCSDLGYGQCEDYYVIIKTTVGTLENADEWSVRVYPNPSAGETWLEFTLPEAQPVQLNIADQMGRMVWESKLENINVGLNRLLLPELPAGAYALSVKSGAMTTIEKMIRTERP